MPVTTQEALLVTLRTHTPNVHANRPPQRVRCGDTKAHSFVRGSVECVASTQAVASRKALRR